jgi:uncharacterized protein (TIRG00374 family)
MLVIILVNNDASAIFKAIKQADIKYILIALAFILLFILFTAFSLMQLVRLKKKIRVFDSFNIANLANFYNGITPFASGGQPFQVYYYTKVNVKTDESTSVLMMNFIIHQFVSVILSVIAICLYYDDLNTITNNNVAFKVAVWIGLIINVVILLLLIFVSFSKTVKKFFMWLIKIIFSIKFLRKKRESMIQRTNDYFDKSQESFKELFKHIPTLLLSILYKVIALLSYFIVPFFIFKALNVDITASKIMYIIWMTAFAYVIMSFMPTPGSSGGAEWAFEEVFALSFAGVTGAITASAILLWRFLTYYLVMILGAISAICVKRRKEDEEECELESSQTATYPKSTE